MFNKIIFICCFCVCTIFGNEDSIVEISNGKLKGSFNGKYHSFKGIRYAEPPIGKNRFESPKPFLEKWNNVRDASTSGNICMQLDHITTPHQIDLVGEEDCLYINVYTPKIDTENLLPVMFYIHGGAFMFGSGDFHHENLVMSKENMVLVSFNYRLGPLGFMNTEDGEIRGNMGLKDQRLALKWVHENIKNFGGDPKNVVMGGFSAGAASVEYHLLQPGIEEYISAAFSFSGSALCSWSIKTNPLQDVKKLATILKCPQPESTSAIKDCLKDIPVKQIVESSKEFLVYDWHPVVIWGPSVESSKSDDAMITEMPEDTIKKGKTANVPYLSSFVSQEGAFLTADLLYQKKDTTTDLEYFNQHYKEILPAMILYKNQFSDEESLNKHTDKLYDDFGIVDKTVTLENFANFTRMATELVMTNCIKKSWKLHKTYSPSKYYFYEYDHPSKYGLANMIANRADINFGCVHGDDVFLMLPLNPNQNYDEVEKRHSESFLKLLESFSKNGVPKYGSVDFPVNDKSSKEISYLHIKEQDAVVENIS